MKNRTLALLLEPVEEAFSHSAKFGCRGFALFRVIVLLALTFPVVLAAQPSIVNQPQSVTVVPGATVTFSVTAAGSALDYQWLENYSQLAGQTNSSLVLTDVSTNSAARYAVVVSNASGAVTSSPAILSILTGPPSIQVQPQSQSVWGGTPVAFSASVTGGGASGSFPVIGSGTLQLWLRADSGVIASSGGLVSLWDDQSGNANDAAQPNTNLQPALVFAADLGGWPVVRFNGIQDNINGSYLFGPGTVNVPNAMTSFTVYDAFSSANTENVIWDIGVPDEFGGNRIDMIVGGDMYFSFWNPGYAAPFIVPTNTYRIRIDQLDTNLDILSMSDLTANGATNFTTSMSGANTPAAGYYLGGLNSSAGPYVGSSRNFGGDIAEIIVYQGLLSDQDRLGVLYYLQQKYYQIDGPGLSFQWLFNGTNLAGATNAFLAFPNVQAEQAGTYSLVASNVYGAVTSSNAVLEVNLIPIILAQPTNEMVIANQPAAFSVLAEGPTPLQYQWTFDGTNILGATNSALAFSNALPSEAGTYSVILGTEPNVTISSNVVLSLYPSNEIISSLDPGQLNIALQSGGTVTFAIDGTIVLTNTITLSNSVILDGTNHSVTISGGGAVELFILPSGLSLTLRHLTLANGLQNGNYLYNGETYPGAGYGGAIFTQGNIDIESCTFASNSVISPSVIFYDGGSTQGGAIFNSGTMTISNTVFMNNSALGGDGGAEHYENAGTGSGGAIYNSGGTISMGNVTFSNNAAGGGGAYPVIYGGHGGAGYGGAIFSEGGLMTGDNLQFINNTAGGGGIYYDELPNGPGYGGSALGGALCLVECVASVSNTTFSNNLAVGASGYDGGGGVSEGGSIFSSGSTFLWHCALNTNQSRAGTGAAGMGGAIFNSATMQIVGSTLSSNGAEGGATQLPDSPFFDGLGGAIYNTGNTEIEGSIISGNGSFSGFNGYGGPFGGYPGNAWGGGIANTGFVQLSSTILSSNTTSGEANFGAAIYSTGVIQCDSNSTLMPFVTGTPPLTFQWQTNGSNIVGSTNSIFNLGSVQFANSGTYDLVISNATGLVTNFLEIVNQPPPPLTISSVTPNTGLTLGGTSVTIKGTGFTNGATVSFGSAAATSVTVVSATNITATTPAADAAGAVNVTVINGDFAPVVLTNGFTYVAPISVAPPPQGPGTNGIFVVDVGGAGISGYNFTVEASTDLVNWLVLQTNSSPFAFTDTNAGSYPRRFYRAVLTQ